MEKEQWNKGTMETKEQRNNGKGICLSGSADVRGAGKRDEPLRTSAWISYMNTTDIFFAERYS